MKKLIYGVSFLALIGIIVVGCQKENLSNPSNSTNNFSSVDMGSSLISQIEEEVNNVLIENSNTLKFEVSPENKNNPYDYAGINFKGAMESINKNWNKINDKSNVQPYTETYTSFYVTKGYSLQTISDTTDLIVKETNNSNQVDEFLLKEYNNQNISLIEKNLYKSYLNKLKIKDRNVFILVSKIYENYIIKSNVLSSLSKKNLLSVISVLKYSATLPNPVGGGNLRPSLDTTCGGTMIVHIVAGAIVGNGLGAAVGFFTGMWSDYAAGCFD